MDKMPMPEDNKPDDKETKAEDAMPGDSFSEQIAKLMPKDKALIEKLTARFCEDC